jgi:hypothetical protein
MTQIVLTPEQEQILQTAGKMVTVCRPDGSIAGIMALTPKEPVFSPEEIAAAQQIAESEGPWYTTKEVLERLRTQERA